ncbi:AfsR/SARP family transcriptional regulator [Streptomyces rishiriensis]|uniref:DNA-binding SARP family transcriptional activator n=1 Tax=Streptomyces rishiriensis TaxID=68264 RepID=A0ABU0NGH3_STRRH|nr:BTAD domain-containing putative transcriptional regulator [Streptomyces rishiriensis]MDQ0578211.1 DNA-binding SARP family transcriptional activator [Streptomyces rishiriensis]
MNEELRFALLGPVRAWRGLDEIDLGPPQQRLVVAALLLADGSPVPSCELVSAVWGVRVPASAAGVLRTYIHRLRKALEPAGASATSVIRYTGSGYQLLTAPGQSDLAAFRELVSRAEGARRAGDTEHAAEAMREALALWRGTALAGVAGEYAQTQRQRLGELRLSAQASLAAAELDLGLPEKAAAELTGLVSQYPLDERFRELLMLALYRSGRQAAALETYREAQTLLADELGVDPSLGLQVTYRHVLRADPALLTPSAAAARPAPAAPRAPAPQFAAATVVPAQLPLGIGTFVGRTAELDEIAGLPSDGAATVIAVAGMAGVGKTAFAVHWARRIADRYPGGQLYLNLRGYDPAGMPVGPEAALRTLLISLGADPGALPRDMDALAALYRTLLADRRVLVLLDNARDAAQIRPLLPGTSGCLAIVTSRNRLTGLIALNGAHPVNLDVLTKHEARALLASRLGHDRIAAEPNAVDEIVTRCARLPLALAVTAARAATRTPFPLAVVAAELQEHARSLDAFHDTDTAADIRAVFSWSYHALTPGAARLFRLLALHPGPQVTLLSAASLVAVPVSHARKLLSELLETHLLGEPVAGRYTAHDLLRAYAAELTQTLDSPDEARTVRHRLLDHYLHTARTALALTAERALIPMGPAVDGVCIEDFGGDTVKATRWFAAEQAALLAAVELAAIHHYDVHCWQLAWSMANQLHWRGLSKEMEAVHHTAMAAARRLDDRVAQAHIHNGLATATAGLGRFNEAEAHARHAIELSVEAGDTHACAESYRTLAWSAEQQGEPEASLTAAQRFLAFLRMHDDLDADDSRGSRALAAALNAVGWCHALLGQHQQALEHSQQALVLCQELDCVTGSAQTWDSIGSAHHNLGQYELAVTAYRSALGLYRRGGFPWLTADILKRLGDTHLSLGDPRAARAVWNDGLCILEQLNHADIEGLRARLHGLGGSADLPEPDTASDEARLALPPQPNNM